MAISSNTTGLRPGVCTSTSRPVSPYEGQMIYTTDLDTLEIWDGSVWKIIGQATTSVASNLDNMGLRKIATASASGSLVSISNVFSSQYDSYRVVCEGLRCNTGTRFLGFYFGPSSIGGYNSGFYNTRVEVNQSGTLLAGHIINGSYWENVVVDSTNAGGGVIEIYNPNNAKTATQNSQYTDSRTNGALARFSGGVHNSTNQFTQLNVIVVGDSFRSEGTISVYGYVK